MAGLPLTYKEKLLTALRKTACGYTLLLPMDIDTRLAGRTQAVINERASHSWKILMFVYVFLALDLAV